MGLQTWSFPKFLLFYRVESFSFGKGNGNSRSNELVSVLKGFLRPPPSDSPLFFAPGALSIVVMVLLDGLFLLSPPHFPLSRLLPLFDELESIHGGLWEEDNTRTFFPFLLPPPVFSAVAWID